jgi:hypothetical protein
MAPAQPDLLEVVERSPQAAAAHDRAGWVGLFSDDGRVEDPVGSRPHIGLTRIGRFYDTFIGPREIGFHRDLDIVGDSVVVRDLELEVAMGSAVTMHIPAFLRYDLHEVDGEWRFAALRAYWELPAMVRQFLRNGLPAVPAAAALSWGLLRNQGFSGTVGFAAGFRRAGSRHKTLLDRFVRAAGRGDQATATQALAADGAITFGDNDKTSIAELIGELGDARWTKMIGAGPTVVASIAAEHGRGVLFADLTRRGDAITRIRYFPR